MKIMKIDDINSYSKKVNFIFGEVESFCESIEIESLDARKKGKIDQDIEDIVKKIKNIKNTKDDDNKVTKENALIFFYQHAINFLTTNQVDKIGPISEKFISNIVAVSKNERVVHHSHVTGEIIGHAHNFCKEKVRENYYTIAVIAHNQFRFDLFLFLTEYSP